VPELLLDLLGSDADHHHLAPVLGGQPQAFLHRDLVEGVDLVLEAVLHDAGAVGLHLDLGHAARAGVHAIQYLELISLAGHF